MLAVGAAARIDVFSGVGLLGPLRPGPQSALPILAPAVQQDQLSLLPRLSGCTCLIIAIHCMALPLPLPLPLPCPALPCLSLACKHPSVIQIPHHNPSCSQRICTILFNHSPGPDPSHSCHPLAGLAGAVSRPDC